LRNIIKDADVNLDVIYNEMDDVKWMIKQN
jgi:hypothetical protein